jgi:hypothetical protein
MSHQVMILAMVFLGVRCEVTHLSSLVKHSDMLNIQIPSGNIIG